MDARCLLFALAFVAHGAIAGEIVGRVVAIADGDTLTVLDARKRQHKIRLDGIDAPERRQAFGKRSRQSLAELCSGKAAIVQDQGKDRYRRTIGRVTCAGVDANAEQVRRGMAWVYKRYVHAGLRRASNPFYWQPSVALTGKTV
jgi:endonuclease YncB( thermonuclease family)